jgi:hypothetical protein
MNRRIWLPPLMVLGLGSAAAMAQSHDMVVVDPAGARVVDTVYRSAMP